MRLLNEQGFSVNKLIINKDGFTVIMDAVRRKLYSLDSNSTYHYLEELYEDYIIYSKRGNDGEKLYKQSYAIVDDQVELIGDPIQVVKHVDITYTTNTLSRTKFINNKKEEDISMSKEKTPCEGCMEKIVTIIQSNETPYTEDHREWLLTQEEAFLDKLIPKEPVIDDEPVQVNTEQALEVLRETLKKPEDFINLLPEEMKDSMKSGLTLHQEARGKMIAEIQDNAKDVWTKEELDKMNFSTLRKVHSSLKIPVDYSLQADVTVNNDVDQEVLPAPGVELKTE